MQKSGSNPQRGKKAKRKRNIMKGKKKMGASQGLKQQGNEKGRL